MIFFLLFLCSGFHLAVIHGENDLLDKLLFIMSRDNRLRTVIDEQNNLYQVSIGGRDKNLDMLLDSNTI